MFHLKRIWRAKGTVWAQGMHTDDTVPARVQGSMGWVSSIVFRTAHTVQ